MGETDLARQGGPSTPAEPRGKFKRRSWSKWVLTALVLFWVATAAGWFYWDRTAEQMLQEEIGRVRAAGEPLEWAELAAEPVPDDQNAAVLYLRAWDLLSGEGVRSDGQIDPEHRERLLSMIGPMMESPDFRRERADELDQLLEMTQEALALCREARGRPKVYWRKDFSAPAMEMELPPLRRARETARLQRLAGVVAHEQGRDDEAVAHIRDALHMADAIGELPSLIASLVSRAVMPVMTMAVEEILPGLRVGDEDGAAPREDVLALISELLETESLQDGFVLGMMSSRSMDYDTCERFRKNLMGEPVFAEMSSVRPVMRFLDPMFKVDQALLLRDANVHIRAAKAGDYPSAIAIVSESTTVCEDAFNSRLWTMSHPLLSILSPAYGGILSSQWEAVAQRQMAGMALAMRLYELDAGRRPESLEELVPEYLESVPTDPFAPDRTITYRHGETPMLYCLGTNMTDDGGQDGSAPGEGDVVFYLNDDRPRSEPHWEDPHRGALGSEQPVDAGRCDDYCAR